MQQPSQSYELTGRTFVFEEASYLTYDFGRNAVFVYSQEGAYNTWQICSFSREEYGTTLEEQITNYHNELFPQPEEEPEPSTVERLIEELDTHTDDDAIAAYVELVGEEYATAEGFQDSYQGFYFSDEHFAEEFATSIGFETTPSWPASCIDWEQAARELMYDYSELNGYYFRNL